MQCGAVALFAASRAPADASSPDHYHGDSYHGDSYHGDGDGDGDGERANETAIDVLYHTYPHISLQEIGKRSTRVELRQIVRLSIV